MKKYFVILFVLLFFNNVIFSSFNDTGFIKWNQPNGIEFIARSWGDEFFNWMKTDDGYIIVDSPEGWYYYAVLDKNGEFTASDARVGIDKALLSSKNLERTATRISKLKSERKNFDEQLLEINSTLNLSVTNTTIKLGVVLIDFPTNRKRITTYRPEGYLKAEFENMLFSDYTYFSTKDKYDNLTSPHPENEEVFGSLKDYYIEMSVGNYQIVGKNFQPQIVNPPSTDNSSLPEWFVLEHEMSYYDSLSSLLFMDVIYNEITDVYGSTEMDSYDVICFIYGGAERTSGNFRPKARGNKYCVGEYKYDSFAHIGTHAHEFAHAALGAHDEYAGDPTIDPKLYSLMSYGVYNGPLGHGSCPAPFSPYYRIEYGWVNPTIIAPNVTNYSITFGSPTPNYYIVNIPASDEYFILETRHGAGFDKYTPKQDGNNTVGGILIWHIDPDDLWDYVELEYADNNSSSQNENNRFPFPLIETQDFNNSTIPSTKLRNGTYSSISIDNIDWIGYTYTGYGSVDVIDLVPSVPTGFTMSGNVGQHPTLSWEANSELDLAGYKLYQSIDGSTYSLLATFSNSTTSFTDNGVTIGDSKFDPYVCYKFTAYDLAGGESYPSLPRCTQAAGINKQSILYTDLETPKEYMLFDAYPNPFNPTTTIKFAVPENTDVKITVYNMLGEEITILVNTYLMQGFYEINFDASKLTSGTYIYKMQTNNFSQVKKLLLVK